jgi:CSLREA domain-containing protein
VGIVVTGDDPTVKARSASFVLEKRMFKKAYPNIFMIMIVALLALVLLPVRKVSAAPSFTVNSFLDEIDDNPGDGICHSASNHCTLRAAVMEANRSSGLGATIVLPSGIYTLAIPASGADGEENGDLNLTATPSGNPAITISGAGAGTTIIDANQIDRVFFIDRPRTATISGVTIRNGYVAGIFKVGGGIYTLGNLTITDSTITNNTSGPIGISGSWGGGINATGGLCSLEIINSTISQNSAVNGGGGILSECDHTVITNSTISVNSSNLGGGINVLNSLTLINSTLSGNSAKADGGGIYMINGSANIYNSSIVFNRADADAINGGLGGGIYTNSTTVNLRNSLVAENSVLSPSFYSDCFGTLHSYGRNLFWDVFGGCTVIAETGSWDYLNPFNSLSPLLQNNGGPTMTHALLAGSNAIDGGDPDFGCLGPDALPFATDQRGTARVVGASCDIGAFEYSPQRYVYLPLTLR